MNHVVKQLVNDDGENVPEADQCWHVVTSITGEPCLLCTGEFIDDGGNSGHGAAYEHKRVKRGGVTCDQCLADLMTFKNFKL